LDVLDCYTNQGGFALNAAAGGAKSVTAVDSSKSAISMAQNNAAANSFDDMEFVEADVVDYLNLQISKGRKWDLIVLDPPAFAKNRKSIKVAQAGYAKINRLAMKLLNKGGFLVSASCSHHIPEATFNQLITTEAAKLRRQSRLIFRGAQSPDHLILSSMPETRYLKFFVYQIF
jgi:23S rRNA (cytosine1962-C5)-methyltransferase